MSDTIKCCSGFTGPSPPLKEKEGCATSLCQWFEEASIEKLEWWGVHSYNIRGTEEASTVGLERG
jgi:hypothetical protein